MPSFEPCPLCDRKAVYSVGGTKRIRRHSPPVNWREQPWCPASGFALSEINDEWLRIVKETR